MIAVLGAIVGSYVMLSIWPSMKQKQSQVFRRKAGGTLHFWKSLSDASELHWPYAWAAVASYQDSFDPKRKPLAVTAACPEPHAFLSQRGWVQWTELPSLEPRPNEKYSDAAQKMREVHLRAEVWSNATTHQVVVAFGGTAASSWNDWKSNLRWFVFHPHDEYTVSEQASNIDQNLSGHRVINQIVVMPTGVQMGRLFTLGHPDSIERARAIVISI